MAFLSRILHFVSESVRICSVDSAISRECKYWIESDLLKSQAAAPGKIPGQSLSRILLVALAQSGSLHLEVDLRLMVTSEEYK